MRACFPAPDKHAGCTGKKVLRLLVPREAEGDVGNVQGATGGILD